VGLVTLDGSTEGEADLVAAKVLGALFERSRLAQRVAAVEAERTAMEVVRARLCDDRQGTTRGAPNFGVETVVDDPELTDGVLAEAGPRQSKHLVGEIHAIHDDGGFGSVPRGTDECGIADKSVAAPFALHARRDEGQVLEVTVGNRKLQDLLGNDVCGGIRLVDVHHRRLGGNRDGFGNLHLHGENHSRRLADTDRDVMPGRGKAGKRHRNVVLTGRQRRYLHRAPSIRDARALRAGFVVDHQHCHPRHGQAFLIVGVHLDGTGRHLRRRREGEPHQHGQAGRHQQSESPAISHSFLPSCSSTPADTAT